VSLCALVVAVAALLPIVALVLVYHWLQHAFAVR